jgi:hypothetical protein
LNLSGGFADASRLFYWRNVITSPDNEKLKTVRKLRQKKHREALGLFVTEGEDLMKAGLAAGRVPKALLVHPDAGIEGDPVEPALLDGVSALGSGTRVIGIWRSVWADSASETCVFLDAVSDPGNVGTIIRTVDALLEATVVLERGPGKHGLGIQPAGDEGRDRSHAGAADRNGGRRRRSARGSLGTGHDLPRIRARRGFRARLEALWSRLDHSASCGGP